MRRGRRVWGRRGWLGGRGGGGEGQEAGRVIDYNHRRTGAATDPQSLGTPGRRSTLFRLPEASGGKRLNIYAASRIASEQPPLVATLLLLLPLLLLLLSFLAADYFSLDSFERLLTFRERISRVPSLLRLKPGGNRSRRADAGVFLQASASATSFTNPTSPLFGFRLLTRYTLSLFFFFFFKDTGAAT